MMVRYVMETIGGIKEDSGEMQKLLVGLFEKNPLPPIKHV